MFAVNVGACQKSPVPNTSLCRGLILPVSPSAFTRTDAMVGTTLQIIAEWLSEIPWCNWKNVT